ncbi:Ribosomal RNA small subunit methyltransferase E [Rickettsiales endosymbiont of Paramecium tredecaurelia]|uniref:RsmE family RNA methyltransferase n=1 Tax=Candidatus Sarmatiella mevalonica TaxID=2770581 RepID=UPI001921E7B9|nr:RsmE family RNA methyltransferase [Candidatus Sarmatiella mevalonica]MBL3284395.1 Ribosomal RNA small subunit methyltransferase E [Candidatus Sarmatiella mevalonica]
MDNKEYKKTHTSRRVNRLYYEDKIALNSIIHLSHQYKHYLHNVLRLKVGDDLIIFNQSEGEFITSCHKIPCAFLVHQQLRKPKQHAKNHCTFDLALGLLKPDKLYEVIDAGTQMNIAHFHLFDSAHSYKMNVNKERLLKITIEATEQSNRLHPPSFNHCKLDNIPFQEYDAVCYCSERIIRAAQEAGGEDDVIPHNHLLTAVDQTRAYNKILILVGPAGGFSRDEDRILHEKDNILAWNISNNILRSEVAATVAIAYAQLLFYNR